MNFSYWGKKGTQFNDYKDDLFQYPDMGTGRVSNLKYLADNSFMFACLLNYMNGISCSTLPPLVNIELTQSMRVTYSMNDKWFVITVIFGVLNFLGIAVAGLLYYCLRKKRLEY
jgi:hypothetical protein